MIHPLWGLLNKPQIQDIKLLNFKVRFTDFYFSVVGLEPKALWRLSKHHFRGEEDGSAAEIGTALVEDLGMILSTHQAACSRL